ncbi:hypothetical protein [Streptomyces hygroscopicus]|uniref:hypothetical protein n=1 Tax=Streptomyces hygroscopicus TaxID=1912 RepID=UPI0036800509
MVLRLQTSLTGEQTPDAERQETRKAQKAKAKDGLGKAEEVLLPLLEELAEKKPEDLAVILGDNLTRHVKVVGKLYSRVPLVPQPAEQGPGHPACDGGGLQPQGAGGPEGGRRGEGQGRRGVRGQGGQHQEEDRRQACCQEGDSEAHGSPFHGSPGCDHHPRKVAAQKKSEVKPVAEEPEATPAQ